VGELTWPVHARVKLLLALVPAIAAVRLERVASAVGQNDAAALAIERDVPDQALLAEVLQAVVSAIEAVVTWVEIAL
jgi:hypothetical protein